MGSETTFFSYSRSDSDFVLKLASDLRQAETDVWLDQLDIDAGNRWDHAVEEALKSSNRMVVILSPDSVSSNNVMDEVSFALEEGKSVVPILFKSCDIPFRLRRLQHIDFTQNYDEALKNLLLALKHGKTTSDLTEVDDSKPITEEEQKSEKVKDKTKAEEQKLKAETEAKRQEEEQKLKDQAEAEKREDERRLKEQAEQVEFDNESTNINEAPYPKENNYKRLLTIAKIIVILVVVIWGGIQIWRSFRPVQLDNTVNALLEYESWKNALNLNSIDGFKTYQQNYPTGSHFDEAQDSINNIEDRRDWGTSISLNTKDAYQEYLKKHPDGLRFSEANQKIKEIDNKTNNERTRNDEDNAWNTAKSTNTVASYHSYTSKYPTGRYSSEASKRITALRDEDNAWNVAKSTNTIASYNYYKKKYPNGSRVGEAQQKIDVIENQQRLARIAENDKREWNIALKINTIDEYKAYQHAFPKGHYYQQAQQMIDIMQEQALCKPPFDPNTWYRLTQWSGTESMEMQATDSGYVPVRLVATRNVPEQAWKIISLGEGWYRFHSQSVGETQSIDLIDDKGQWVWAPQNMKFDPPRVGLYWRITPLNDGRYGIKLTKQSDGGILSLGLRNDGTSNKNLLIRRTMPVSSQSWRIQLFE